MSRFGVALLVVLVAILAGGCRKVVSDQVLETVVADLMFTVSGVEVDVDCPAGVTMRTDEDFFCHTDTLGRKGTVLVRQVDDYGHVELVNESPVDPAEVEPLVERYLEREFELEARATCPENVIEEPDENFACRIEGHDPVQVRQVDGVGAFTFQFEGADNTGRLR